MQVFIHSHDLKSHYFEVNVGHLSHLSSVFFNHYFLFVSVSLLMLEPSKQQVTHDRRPALN